MLVAKTNLKGSPIALNLALDFRAMWLALLPSTNQQSIYICLTIARHPSQGQCEGMDTLRWPQSLVHHWRGKSTLAKGALRGDRRHQPRRGLDALATDGCGLPL